MLFPGKVLNPDRNSKKERWKIYRSRKRDSSRKTQERKLENRKQKEENENKRKIQKE